MLLTLIIIAVFAGATYHSATIAAEERKHAIALRKQLDLAIKQADELAAAYREAMAIVEKYKKTEDHEDPEYC